MSAFQWYLYGVVVAFLVIKIIQHKIENLPKEKKVRMPAPFPKGNWIFVFLSLFSWFMVGLIIFSFIVGYINAYRKSNNQTK